MEFLFFIFPILLLFGTHRLAVKPFLTGELEIDQSLFPTLARTQKILRARNPKARQKELAKEITRLRSDTDHEIYNSQKIALDALNESRKKHKDSLNEWDVQFKTLTLPEELAEQARQKAEMELKEAARLKAFIAEQKEQAKLASEAMYDTWRSNETLYNAKAMAWSTNPYNAVKYDTRLIDPNMRVNVRDHPTSQSRLWGTLLPSTTVEVTGWVYGERLNNASVWFKVITPDSSEAYIWGGALTDQSTYGLTDLNKSTAHTYQCDCPDCLKDYEYETLRSFDGTVHRTYPTRQKNDYQQFHQAFEKETPKKLNNTGSEHHSSSLFQTMKAPESTSWSLYD